MVETFTDAQWTVRRVRNPWGRVPLTASGRALAAGAKTYMDRLLAKRSAPDTRARRHHYVPQAYLREWSSDGKRLFAWDTTAGAVRKIGIADLCVEENFYRVVGPDGAEHNKVELLFGVVDQEMRRVQSLFIGLDDPEKLGFDDLLGLGVSMSTQRNRTTQERRIHLQYNRWETAQDDTMMSFENPDNPYLLAGIMTELMFTNLWEAADVLTSRQIEVWHDDQGRFRTCDAPVLVPFDRSRRHNLTSAPYIWWPVSPHRVIALSNEPAGEKAVIRPATGKMVGLVNRAVEQGRERMIFASDEQWARLGEGKRLTRRAQLRLRCSDRTPTGEYVAAPGCCVERAQGYGTRPDVALCDRGLHRHAPNLDAHR